MSALSRPISGGMALVAIAASLSGGWEMAAVSHGFRRAGFRNFSSITRWVSMVRPTSRYLHTFAHLLVQKLELESGELQSEIATRFGGSVEMIKLKHGIFDEAALSIITLATIVGIGRKAGMDLDRRRFRANIVLETHKPEPFQEDGWVGRRLVFGDDESGPVVSVTMRDVRCSMVNLDPDTARKDERVMKTVVELNRNNAGVYATVVQTGRIRVGQAVSLVKC